MTFLVTFHIRKGSREGFSADNVRIQHDENQQVFSTEAGHSLSIRCLPGARTFELTNTQTQEIIQNDSMKKQLSTL